MLQIRNLRVERGGQTICELPELRVEGGERVCVVGPNGSGKTTLLRVVGGLDREFHGECRADVPFRDRVYLHQSPYLFRGSVLANVLFERKVCSNEGFEIFDHGHHHRRHLGGDLVNATQLLIQRFKLAPLRLNNFFLLQSIQFSACLTLKHGAVFPHQITPLIIKLIDLRLDLFGLACSTLTFLNSRIKLS